MTIPSELAPIDLTRFCRPGLTATIELHMLNTQRFTWIKCGTPIIRPRGNGDDFQSYQIGARLGRNASDDEHDPAWAFCFEVVGFKFGHLNGGIHHAYGWIRADDPNSFNVPLPGQDPFASAKTCDGGKHCRWTTGPHPIVEYMPRAKHAQALYNIVRGWPISMSWHHFDQEGEE
jgi:hypothetical protein